MHMVHDLDEVWLSCVKLQWQRQATALAKEPGKANPDVPGCVLDDDIRGSGLSPQTKSIPSMPSTLEEQV